MELREEKIEPKTAQETLKVLIADDDPPTRILLRAAIAQWGFEVIETKDGEEAWNILQTPEAPRLLIIDWLMPKLDGVALCLRIKNELPFQPYIILLTQVAGTTNIIKALEAGANEFLSKPFNMAELRSRLFVGVRVINYQITLAKQNELLKQFAEQAANITTLEKELANNIELLMQNKNYEKNPEIQMLLQQLQHIQSNLLRMNQVIANYQLEFKNIKG